jgi:hypothetical protein
MLLCCFCAGHCAYCWRELPWCCFGRLLGCTASALLQLIPKGWRMPKTVSHRTGPDDVRYNLVFFSTIEELKLHQMTHGRCCCDQALWTPWYHVSTTRKWVMWLLQRTCWAESPFPPACWTVTQLQLSPTSTAKRRIHVSLQVVQTQQRMELHRRSSSNFYEINKWLWQFARGKASLGGLII